MFIGLFSSINQTSTLQHNSVSIKKVFAQSGNVRVEAVVNSHPFYDPKNETVTNVIDH